MTETLFGPRGGLLDMLGGGIDPLDGGIDPLDVGGLDPLAPVRGGREARSGAAREEQEPLRKGLLGWTDHVQSKLIVMYGERGAGKSASATAMGRWAQQKFDDGGTGQKVLANYPCEFLRRPAGPVTLRSPLCTDEKAHKHSAQCIVTIELEQWNENMWALLTKCRPDWAVGSLVLMDESADVVSAWGAMSNHTRDVIAHIRQIRKLECDIIATTQYPQRMAQAFNEQTNLFILVEPGPRPLARWVAGALVRPKPKYAWLNCYKPVGGILPMDSRDRAPLRRLKLDLELAMGGDDEAAQYDSWHRVAAVWEQEAPQASAAPMEA